MKIQGFFCLPLGHKMFPIVTLDPLILATSCLHQHLCLFLLHPKLTSDFSGCFLRQYIPRNHSFNKQFSVKRSRKMQYVFNRIRQLGYETDFLPLQSYQDYHRCNLVMQRSLIMRFLILFPRGPNRPLVSNTYSCHSVFLGLICVCFHSAFS